MREHENMPFLATADASGMAGAAAGNLREERSPEGLIDALESVIVVFERLIANRSRDELRQAAQDGGWGVVEILSHLLDWEEITHARVWRMLEEDRPELEEYDDSLWAIEHEYGEKDAHKVFEQITRLRCDLVERLRGLDETDWQRPAMLQGRGEITLAWLMGMVSVHDAKYVAEARDALG